MIEPNFKIKEEKTEDNFGRFVIYIALLNLATQIAGPFFAVYMLRDLGFSYKMFMVANVTTAIVSLLSMPLWGKFGDRFGNVRAMKITAVLVAIIPFLWIFSDNFYYIIAIQIVSGFGWAGMNLCHFNFIYDTVTPQRRAICSSYLNILRGFGVLIGAVAGGLIATYVTVDFFKYSLYLVFLLSGILRFYNLGHIPVSLNWDEVSHGWNAYSILKTGQDEWGKAFPIANFRAYGDYPLPLNLYFTIPFIKAFGLNTLAIRLPHVLLGTLTILSSYFVFLGVTKRKDISLLGAFFVAIDPWLLFPSRFVLQSNLSVFFITTAVALFVNGKFPLSFFNLLFGNHYCLHC